MLQATISQMHVPQLCKCPYHKNKVFVSKDTTEEFHTHKEMVDTLAKWHKQQGQDACWVYRIVKVDVK